MPTSSLAKIPRTYAELLRAVKQTLLTGQREIDGAWVRTYHETGRLITEHILHFAPRADYGAKVYHGLARDTGANERKLYWCAQFYRCIPILNHGSKLNWAHFRVLCQVDDPVKRLALMKEAEKKGWTSPELTGRVRALNATLTLESGAAPAKPVVELLTPKRGIVGRYRVVAVADAFGATGGRKVVRRCRLQTLPAAPAGVGA